MIDYFVDNVENFAKNAAECRRQNFQFIHSFIHFFIATNVKRIRRYI